MSEAVPDVARTGAEVERLLAQLTGDERTHERVEELVGLLMRLYGEGLARIVELVSTHLDDPQAIAELFVADDLVSSLLILHGLHPVPLDERVRAALVDHPGTQLAAMDDKGVAFVELTPTGCGSSAAGRLRDIERALLAAVADLSAVEIRELPRPQAAVELISVDALFPGRPASVSR